MPLALCEDNGARTSRSFFHKLIVRGRDEGRHVSGIKPSSRSTDADDGNREKPDNPVLGHPCVQIRRLAKEIPTGYYTYAAKKTARE